MTGTPVRRALKAALGLQIALGAALVWGDMTATPTGGLRLPGAAPRPPALTEPVRPGDQRRRFDPAAPRPATRPGRDPGALPDRLVLSRIDAETWRLEGGIGEGDAERIAARLGDLKPLPETLVLQSPGGSVTDALTLGREIRRLGLVTRMLPGEFCYSACPYLLAAGTARRVPDAAAVGVHQHYFGESTLLPARFAIEDIQRGQAEVMVYLAEMGVDPAMTRHAMATPPDEIYLMLPGELDEYALRTAAE
ncbi:COG3904 family protein [Roseivivax sp. CAU 1761]